jgi:hypothetical protein
MQISLRVVKTNVRFDGYCLFVKYIICEWDVYYETYIDVNRNAYNGSQAEMYCGEFWPLLLLCTYVCFRPITILL